MRIGHGYDVHRFGPGDHVMLAGIRVDFERGIIAHSDGDVLIHALCDALLGASGLGDIGRHFPDSDAQWAGADSKDLLRHVHQLVGEQGYALGNADLTLIAQAPRVANYIEPMRASLAKVLGVDSGCINVKATTTEKMGYIGRQEGLAAHAVVLLTPR